MLEDIWDFRFTCVRRAVHSGKALLGAQCAEACPVWLSRRRYRWCSQRSEGTAGHLAPTPARTQRWNRKNLFRKKKKKHFVKGTVQRFGEKEFPKGWTIPLNLDYFGLWDNRLKQSVNDFNALKILQDVLLLEKLKALKTLFVFELLGSQILKNTLYMDFRAVTPFCWSHRLPFSLIFMCNRHHVRL